MDFVRLPTGELYVRGHDHTPASIREVLDDHLRGEGMDVWAADATTTSARFAQMWFSPTVGFTHDCALHEEHEAVPGCADSEPVIVVMTGATG